MNPFITEQASLNISGGESFSNTPHRGCAGLCFGLLHEFLSEPEEDYFGLCREGNTQTVVHYFSFAISFLGGKNRFGGRHVFLKPVLQILALAYL